jgi:hypothetical protein
MDDSHALGRKTRVGMFFGYVLKEGGRFSGKVHIVDVGQFQKAAPLT